MNLNIFGHFHPLLVHLPIGILFFAVLIEYGFPKKNSRALMQIILLTGTISAILSALLGWLLSFSGEYDVELLNIHKWAGICLSIITGALWLWKLNNPTFPKHKLVSHLLFVLMLLMLVITGHYGGSLTHGENYLSVNNNNDTAAIKPFLSQSPVTDTTKSSVYDKIVTPILTAKCYQCHSASKKKGNLRMQTIEALGKGGKSGPAFIAGDPTHSELIKRILLDIQDDKRMPPKGKKQLNNDEIAVLYWWIKNGASTTVTVAEVKKNDTIHSFLLAGTPIEVPKLALPNIKKADSLLLVQLQNSHWKVSEITKGSPYLDLNAISFPSLNNEALQKINAITENIVWLHLNNTAIDDQSLQVIGRCTNLLKLNISHTAITSASVMELKKLTKLQFLNIMNTKIDDNGFKKLCEIPGLKKIFCWNSMVTKKVVEDCRKKYPGIVINNGELNTVIP